MIKLRRTRERKTVGCAKIQKYLVLTFHQFTGSFQIVFELSPLSSILTSFSIDASSNYPSSTVFFLPMSLFILFYDLTQHCIFSNSNYIIKFSSRICFNLAHFFPFSHPFFLLFHCLFTDIYSPSANNKYFN